MKRSEARVAGKAFIERLKPIIVPIFTYLEAGSQVAYEFFDKKGRKDINKFLFSGIVRDHACSKLDELMLAGSLSFVREEIANSGIRVIYDKIRLKVLRPGIDEDGDAVLPPPRSEQQELFYKGNYYTGGGDDIAIHHLVMLWQSNHVARSTYAWLACPDEGRGALFSESIPHPATMITRPTLVPPLVEDDSDLYQRKETEQPLTGEVEGEDE